MAELSSDKVLGQVAALLQEAFEGSSQNWTYFTDGGPENGLFGTLAKVSAAQASQPVCGSSVAAQVHHVVFSLKASAAWIRGDRSSHDWAQSWSVRTVDDAAWADLLSRLRAGYQELRNVVAAHGGDGVEAYGGAVGAVAHFAYHLGAIRQKIAGLR